jgi:arylsulfatase A-like enzyme
LGWATDIVPTVLSLAGVQTSTDFEGKNLAPLLSEDQPQVRGDDEGFGYELGGNKAWFQGDYKLVFNRFGDAPRWQLFNLKADLAETRDLSESESERFDAMRASYDAWAKAHGVLSVAPDYDQRQTVFSKGMRNRPGLLVGLTLVVLVPLLAVFFLVVRWFRRGKLA